MTVLPAQPIVITEAGKKVAAENPEKIDSKYLEQFPSFVDFASVSKPSNGNDPEPGISRPTDLTPDDQLEDAYKQINAGLASDLLSEILKISPYTFEKLVIDLLSKMGYGLWPTEVMLRQLPEMMELMALSWKTSWGSL